MNDARAPALLSTPLVLLHGFLGLPSAWDEVAAALDWSGPVRIPTLPGHGRARLGRDLPFESAVDAIAGRIDVRRPVLLAGYSMGARVALGLALRHPERIAGAVLVGVHPGLRTEAERAERRAWEDALIARVRAGGILEFAAWWEKLPLFESQSRLEPARLESQRRARRSHTPEGIARALRTFGLAGMPSRWEALSAGRVPIHLVTGEQDVRFSAIAAHLCVDHPPRLTHHVIAGAGHNLPLEVPEAVAAEIRAAAHRIAQGAFA